MSNRKSHRRPGQFRRYEKPRDRVRSWGFRRMPSDGPLCRAARNWWSYWKAAEVRFKDARRVGGME